MEIICQLVAVSWEDGGMSIVKIITDAPPKSMSPDFAKANGYTWIRRRGGGWHRDATDEVIAGDIGHRLRPFTSWRRIDPTDIPDDRTFREAWIDGGTIAVDMPKARDIHRNRLRAVRAPKLAALDVEQMRALVSSDTKTVASIEEQKRALRDVPADPAIEAAATPEALAAVMPAALA